MGKNKKGTIRKFRREQGEPAKIRREQGAWTPPFESLICPFTRRHVFHGNNVMACHLLLILHLSEALWLAKNCDCHISKTAWWISFIFGRIIDMATSP